MSSTLAITPAGHLRLEPAPESLPELAPASVESLREAFAQSSGRGLLELAAGDFNIDLPSSLVFWRGYARQYFQAVCQLGEASVEQWAALPPPPAEDLARLAADAPAMRGLEYLTEDVLRELWVELRGAATALAAGSRAGPAAWLRDWNSLWNQLGRVTFHLAENKRDPQRPFAFLATFTHRLSGQSKVQHVPLAEAVKTSASAKDQARLNTLLEPIQRAAERSELARELLNSKAVFSPQAWSIRQAHRFLTEMRQIEEAGIVVRVPDWWSARRPPRPEVQVRIGERQTSAVGLDSLLDFRAELSLEGEELSEAERRQLLAATDGLVLLRGKWVEVDKEKLQQALDRWKRLEEEHPDGIDFITGMRMLAGAKISHAESPQDEIAACSRVAAGSWLRDTLDRLRRPEGTAECQPGRDLRATLRPYQEDGVRWLWLVSNLRLGGCLADDMGLGKTIQVIDLLLQLRRKGKAGPSLLVAPASLLGNWRQELARFAPTLRVKFAHRSECSAEDLARLAADPLKELTDCDLLATTYSLASRQGWLDRVSWSLAVLDEAQAIKNAASAQTKRLKRLQAGCRLALTGTPVENQLGDLWSIFDFCCPGLLGTARQFKDFVKGLNRRQDGQAYGALRRLVRPYILRRLKTDPDIAPDLPAKTEMRAECGLSNKQTVLYERAVEDLAKRLKKADGIARRGLVLSMLMQLKQICNHPSQYLNLANYPGEESAKFQRLALLCQPIAERQERVLVFTQFQTLTEPLARFLADVFGRPGLVLHGGTPVKKRTGLVGQFQAEDGPPFFVISLKAGGSGLNLTAASHVVHFDRWWNPAVENQATDRAFRIGQERNVLVHKFVCRGTLEERIDETIRGKQALADELLNEPGEALLTEMSDDALLDFVALDIGRATADE